MISLLSFVMVYNQHTPFNSKMEKMQKKSVGQSHLIGIKQFLNIFGNKTVKVVSSMGEQSCGKTCLLNHFIGTSFDGSATVRIFFGYGQAYATNKILNIRF